MLLTLSERQELLRAAREHPVEVAIKPEMAVIAQGLSRMEDRDRFYHRQENSILILAAGEFEEKTV